MVTSVFVEEKVLNNLRRYLPHQNPLKDFVHHNTLDAFQQLPFHEALEKASKLFGYKTYLSLSTYRELYTKGKISPKILQRVIIEHKGFQQWEEWQDKLLHRSYDTTIKHRLGQLHQIWTKEYHLNIEKEVHSFLFRIIGSYIDQGIATEKFPILNRTFLHAIIELEKHSFLSIFKSKRVKKLLFHQDLSIQNLLDILVGDEHYYEQYLFDQQFAHAGWSGMVAVLEKHPELLLDKRKISLEDIIIFELLLEIDALDRKVGTGKWKNLKYFLENDKEIKIEPLFSPVSSSELFQVYALWQEAYEWTFYDQVLRGLQLTPKSLSVSPRFQAIFCIDDRCCSIRRYVEKFCQAQTFGTAGFFNFPFYFQPEHGKFYTKSCPVPLQPTVLVKETDARRHHHQKDIHFSRHTKTLVGGWLVGQIAGFWSAIRLAWNIFKPTETPALVSAFRHMDKHSKLHFEYQGHHHDNLQLGFTLIEMADRLEGLFKSIGLTENFTDLVYFIGHGASSVNNTHYAGYDCGACSGRAGSVNARIAAAVANKKEVREILRQRGIDIPHTTHFIGALHDTTRDELEFYDENVLSPQHREMHQRNKQDFQKALAYNAKERARRFFLMDSHKPAEQIHQEVKLRALSLFEPRPEWNHATNALCIVGKRENNKNLFLDRRAFLNSYDYSKDLNGKYLAAILDAVTPVCGGINLEYYFSKVDNHRLGAGTKLPHNVISLIGVANGLEGDLRTGLPAQMLDIHESLRLLIVVEHFPEVVLQVIQRKDATYEWFKNYWVHLVVVHPETRKLYRFRDHSWEDYEPTTEKLPITDDLEEILANSTESLPIYLLKSS